MLPGTASDSVKYAFALADAKQVLITKAMMKVFSWTARFQRNAILKVHELAGETLMIS